MIAGSKLFHVKVSFTDMLGTAPSNPDVYADFIVSKKFAAAEELDKKGKLTQEEKDKVAVDKDALTKEELATLPEEDKGITVFRRHPDTKSFIITDFMVRGFLKEAASAIGGSDGKTWGLTSKIDKWVFVTDEKGLPIRWIPLTRDGAPITQPDSNFSRPLRAMTMQGPRVTLACSERLNDGECEFHIAILPLGGNDKNKLSEEVLKNWFQYAMYCGFGQWRSGGFGRAVATVTAK